MIKDYVNMVAEKNGHFEH